jgi:triosephosphate isomerase
MKKLIVGNWKNNLSLKDSLVLAKNYAKVFRASSGAVVACPSTWALVSVKKILGVSVKLGAQDVGHQERGAHTGDIDAKSLAEIGCTYVIIGHSERRAQGESSAQINLKLKAILKEPKLTPIICIGESWSLYQAKKSKTFVTTQIKQTLAGLNLGTRQIIIAYEPIWAIGTGKAMVASEAQIMHAFIKTEAKKVLGAKTRLMVLYGGSVNGSNSQTYLKKTDIDGLLVGGASLKIQEFKKIANIR